MNWIRNVDDWHVQSITSFEGDRVYRVTEEDGQLIFHSMADPPVRPKIGQSP
jgi:hypothetical protein